MEGPRGSPAPPRLPDQLFIQVSKDQAPTLEAQELRTRKEIVFDRCICEKVYMCIAVSE